MWREGVDAASLRARFGIYTPISNLTTDSVRAPWSAVASQAELIASLRLRLETLERRPGPDLRPDLAGILAGRARLSSVKGYVT